MHMEKEAALIELGKWYFKLYGPAAFEDFTWWTGLTVTSCRHAFNKIKVRLLSLLMIFY